MSYYTRNVKPNFGNNSQLNIKIFIRGSIRLTFFPQLKKCYYNNIKLKNTIIIKLASIYKKPNKYIIHSNSVTTTGLTIASEPFIILPSYTLEGELSGSIVKALISSKNGISHPTDWKKQQELFLSNVGEKSLSSLHSKSVYCGISLDENNIIHLMPTVNLGYKNGYDNIMELEMSVSIDILQNHIFEAISLCK